MRPQAGGSPSMQLLRDLEILTSMAGSLLYTSFVPGIPSGLIRPPSSSSTTWHCRSYCRLLCFGYAFADHEDGVLQVMSRILEAHRMVHGEPLPALMLRGCVSSQEKELPHEALRRWSSRTATPAAVPPRELASPAGRIFGVLRHL